MINSKSLITFNNTDNNFCFWNCIAYQYTKRSDRFTNKSIVLYNEFMKYKFGVTQISEQKRQEYSGFNLNYIDDYTKFKYIKINIF